MWKSFEKIGLQTSEKVSWEKNKKETCVKHKINRSQNGRSNYGTGISLTEMDFHRACDIVELLKNTSKSPAPYSKLHTTIITAA